MIDIFKSNLKNKYFVVWCLVFIFVIYMSFKIILIARLQDMDINNIKDNVYLFYAYLFPLTFSESTKLFSFIIDISYLTIISYVIVEFINFFFITSPSSTIIRVERKKIIKELSIINIIFSILIFLLYIILFIVIIYLNKINLNISSKLILPIILKILSTILIPNLYLYFYVKTDNLFLSTISLIIIYLGFELGLSFLFNIETLSFNYFYIIILLIFSINIYLYKSTKNSFERRDI